MDNAIKREQSQRQYWDSVAGKQWSGHYSYQEVAEINDFIKFMDLAPKSTILEIGAGTGRWTIALLKRDHRVSATDISLQSLGFLKEYTTDMKVATNLILINTSFEEIPVNQKFDCILFGGVIHHISENTKAVIFANIVSTLKPGGTIVAFEPNPLNVLYYILSEVSQKLCTG